MVRVRSSAATRRRPLASSRETTWPTRPRATPSGLTRTSVRSAVGADTVRQRTSPRSSTQVDRALASTYVDDMASPTDVTTAAAADDPDTGLRAIRALRDL